MPSSEGADEFVRIIKSEDQIGAVLRAHLMVEQALNTLLTYKTRRDWSDKYHSGLFGYMHKVDIADCFDLIRADLLQPLQMLGKFRNDMAHKLGFELTDDEQEKFLESIPQVYRDNAARAMALADKKLAEREPDAAAKKIHYLSGLRGRRAVSFAFAAGLFTLLFELWSLLDDLETEDEIKAYEELDEQEGDI